MLLLAGAAAAELLETAGEWNRLLLRAAAAAAWDGGDGGGDGAGASACKMRAV